MKIIDVTEERNQNFELICRQEKVVLFFGFKDWRKKCHPVMECDVTRAGDQQKMNDGVDCIRRNCNY